MYTFKSEKELENIIRIDKSIPNKVIENAQYHIGLVEDSYEDGVCGNFYILTEDNGIDSVAYKDCLTNCNLDEDEYARVAAGGKDYEKEPKSYSGYRKIYVMDELMSLLKQQRNKKRFNDSAYLLTDNQMNPVRVWQISDKYRIFMKSLNIEYKSLHVLRHTYGSILASEGIGAKDLQYMLGHASIVTSFDVYIGSYEENRRKATEKLQKSLFVS